MDSRYIYFLREALSNKGLRFLLAGLINTVIGYAIFAFFVYFEFGDHLSLLFSTVFGVIFNYLNFGKTVFFFNKQWVRFFRFLTTYILIYLLNTVLLSFFIYKFRFDPYVGQMICLPVNVLVSWVLLSKWVYKRDSKC